VLGAARAAGADVARCAQALATIRPEKGRGRRHVLTLPQGAATLIDESYNANPASMKAAIAVLGSAEPGPGGRRIAVLGDMLELGRSSARLHRGLKKQIEAAKVDRVLLIGRHMGALAKDLPRQMLAGHHEDAASAEAPLLALLAPGDVVTIKSSLGTGSAALVAALLREFPETGEATG
jgi:UDP-N-acetylmuramoyl-tripeptide--D-alanyl-D-alanine ligase